MLAANEAVARWFADARAAAPSTASTASPTRRSSRRSSSSPRPTASRSPRLPVGPQELNALLEALRGPRAAARAEPAPAARHDAGRLHGREHRPLRPRRRALPALHLAHPPLPGPAWCTGCSRRSGRADGGQRPRARSRARPRGASAPRGAARGDRGLCSERERAAMEAEREIASFYAALFMQDKVGERFDGVVAAWSSSALFVELEPWLVEGLVKAEDLGGAFELDPELHALVRRRHGPRVPRGRRGGGGAGRARARRGGGSSFAAGGRGGRALARAGAAAGSGGASGRRGAGGRGRARRPPPGARRRRRGAGWDRPERGRAARSRGREGGARRTAAAGAAGGEGAKGERAEARRAKARAGKRRRRAGRARRPRLSVPAARPAEGRERSLRRAGHSPRAARRQRTAAPRPSAGARRERACSRRRRPARHDARGRRRVVEGDRQAARSRSARKKGSHPQRPAISAGRGGPGAPVAERGREVVAAREVDDLAAIGVTRCMVHLRAD